MSELNHMTAPVLLQVENLRVSFKNEEKQYIETVKGCLLYTSDAADE